MKISFIVLILLTINLYAMSMQDLFVALKANPSTKLDELSVQEADVSGEKVNAKLYPKLTLFGRYDNYSSPTGSVPVPPNSLIEMVQNPVDGQPFGYNIYRVGGSFSMPIFVKSIYTYAEQAKKMKASSKEKKKINLLQNEAILVGTNASLLYFHALSDSLKRKEKSLLQTQRFLKIKVKSGRSAEAELYKFNDALTQVEISLNNIALEEQKAYSQIEVLTDIKLSKALDMIKKSEYIEGEYVSLRPLRTKAQALDYGVKAEEEKVWWPSLNADGSYSRSFTKAYNNDVHMYENYGQVGLSLSFALLNKENNVAVQEAKVASMKAKTQLKKESLKMKSQSHALSRSLELLDKSVRLYQKSVKDKKILLDIAKVSFNNGRLSTEEYLRYEDDYVAEEAKLYQSQALSWQTLMQLAVIYGNNIEEMVQ